MSANGNYGRAKPAPIKVLPDQAVDFFECQTPPTGYGKTHLPVTLLPEMAIDFQSAQAALVLDLDVTFRQGVGPEESACDVFRLYAAVNKLELGFQGAGMMPADVRGNGTHGKKTLRVTFNPNNPAGAEERLARLTQAINDAACNLEGEFAARYPTIESCKAQIVEAVP